MENKDCSSPKTEAKTTSPVAKPDHPIAFGPMPIGRAIPNQTPNMGLEPWFVTKISNSTNLADLGDSLGRKSKENR